MTDSAEFATPDTDPPDPRHLPLGRGCTALVVSALIMIGGDGRVYNQIQDAEEVSENVLWSGGEDTQSSFTLNRKSMKLKYLTASGKSIDEQCRWE